MSEHDEFCNCEGCWWSRDQREVCGTCGSLVGAGCPHGETEQESPEHLAMRMDTQRTLGEQEYR